MRISTGTDSNYSIPSSLLNNYQTLRTSLSTSSHYTPKVQLSTQQRYAQMGSLLTTPKQGSNPASRKPTPLRMITSLANKDE